MQTTDTVLMIEPAAFGFNAETAASNAFQHESALTPPLLLQQAQQEFDAMAAQLRSVGITVTVLEDTEAPSKPDAVFPNNWFSTHADGTMLLYPMQAANRRQERRPDIVEYLHRVCNIKRVLDFTAGESTEQYLEGTGSMVLDRVHQKAYACLSPRTDLFLFESACGALGYEPISFKATDAEGAAIYHTNVLMSIGETWVILCNEAIADLGERQKLVQSFQCTGHEVIPITFGQMNRFAGNALLLQNDRGDRFCVLSETAVTCLTEQQINRIEVSARILTVSIPTIERVGGGSARCMMAELF